MEDIWNRIMREQKTVRFRQAEEFSPYCEAAAGSIKPSGDGTDMIEINAFYRYEKIFCEFFEAAEMDAAVRELLYDYLLHLLTRLEVRNGVTRKEYLLRRNWCRLAQGEYGETVQTYFQTFDSERKYKTAFYLAQQAHMGESIALFGKALIALVSDGVLYKNKSREKELIFYLGRKRKAADAGVIAVAIELFLPFLYTLRVFYENSFGVIEQQQSMCIDQIEIF